MRGPAGFRILFASNLKWTWRCPITRIVGLHVAAGDLYAAVTDDEVVLDDEFSVLRLSPNMDPADALLDFANRFRQHLRRLRPAAVAMMKTRRYSSWTWEQAAKRARVEAVITLASAEQEIAYHLVRQEDAARVLQAPRSDFGRALAGTPGTGGWTAWGDRAVALAAALTMQRR